MGISSFDYWDTMLSRLRTKKKVGVERSGAEGREGWEGCVEEEKCEVYGYRRWRIVN